MNCPKSPHWMTIRENWKFVADIMLVEEKEKALIPQLPSGKSRSWRYITVERGWGESEIFCHGPFPVRAQWAGDGESMPKQGALIQIPVFHQSSCKTKSLSPSASLLSGEKQWGTVLNSKSEWHSCGGGWKLRLGAWQKGIIAPLLLIFQKWHHFKPPYVNHHYFLVMSYFQQYYTDIIKVSKSNMILLRERIFNQ